MPVTGKQSSGPRLPGSRQYSARDGAFMRRALELAESAVGLASPNPSVGCLIVRNGKAVGEGWHEYSARDHAEVRALRQAGERARGASAYLTLEPCSHYGRTPPCAPLLIRSGIKRAVVAMTDPNPLVAGDGLDLLRSAGVEVNAGLCREEAARLIEPFACLVTTGRPLVVSKAAMSLDGRIATAAGLDRRLTGPEANEFGQSLRLRLDAILVGVRTVLADDPELTYRGSGKKARPLHRVILDSRLRTPLTARALRGAPEIPALVFCSHDAPQSRRKSLAQRGAEVITVPVSLSGLSLRAVMTELGKHRLTGVLVEGGSRVHWSFVSERLVDKFYFFLAPIVLGGADSVPAVGGEGYRRISRAPRFRITRSWCLGDDLMVEAYPRYSRSIVSPWLPAAELPSGGPCFWPSSERR